LVELIADQEHERLFRDALPLAFNTVRGGRLEPEARAQSRVTEGGDGLTPALEEHLEPPA
jgi:hypothetical protein